MIKICSACRTRQPTANFYRKQAGDDMKRAAVCKQCFAKRYNAKKREREKRKYWERKGNNHTTNNGSPNMPRVPQKTPYGDVHP